MFKIKLRAHNGQYLCAEGGGGKDLRANKNVGSTWETFTVKDENGGRFESGDYIYLAADNGQYLCAEGGGGREVVANRTHPSIWERFTIQKINGAGEIRNGDRVSLRCYNGQYLCAEGGGGREIVANRSRVDVWETFIIEMDANVSILPIRIKENTHIATARHMESIVVLNEQGKLSVQTTTWTTWKAKGYTGAVIIAVLDEHGSLLAKSGVYNFGVDGEWIGRSRRTDLWEENFNPQAIKSAKQIKVFHFHNPSNRLLKELPKHINTLQDIIKLIATVAVLI